MEGNSSVYQVNPVRQIAGEGRAEGLRTWGPDFDQKGAGGGTREGGDEGGEDEGVYEMVNEKLLHVFSSGNPNKHL